MEYNVCRLANGLRIIHLQSLSPVLYCGYGVLAGARDEEKGDEGLAHFCEHVTFKGTERRRAWHILNCLERVGGELNAFTNKEDTFFYAAVLKAHAARAVDLLTDIVFHSVYPQCELEKEVEIVCDEIESYHDSPSELIFDEFENLVFANHPLGHNILGEAERVRQFTSADARRFTSRHYRPDNAVFFAYGDIPFSRLLSMLTKAHACDIATDGQQPAPSLISAPWKPSSVAALGQTVTMERHTHQAHVMIGGPTYRYGDPRRTPLWLLNNILGGPGMNARLNIRLRERNGLVYTVESSMASYTDTGLWATYFGCDFHDIGRCQRLVRSELDKLVQRPLSPSQLAAAKRQLKGQLGVACDNREAFALDFGKLYLHHGIVKDVDQICRRLDAVTAQEIQQVAAEIFAADHLATLIYR